MPTVPFAEAIGDHLRDDAFAVGYLNDSLMEGGLQTFLLALGYIVEARGLKKAALAKDADMDRAGLYRLLDGNGNPTAETLTSLLDALGFRLAVERKVG